MTLREIRGGRETIYLDEQELSRHEWKRILGVDPMNAADRGRATIKRQPIPMDPDKYGVKLLTPVGDFPKIMEGFTAIEKRSGEPIYLWAQGIDFSKKFRVKTPEQPHAILIYEFPQSSKSILETVGGFVSQMISRVTKRG